MNVADLKAISEIETVDAFEEALAAIERGETDHVAVVSPPHGCRDAFLDAAAAELGNAHRVHFGPDAEYNRLDVPKTGVLLLDDCHHRYTRQVGGFERLDELLERLTRTECVAVTSWTRQSWDYLCQARDLDRTFPHVFETPTLSAEGLRELFDRCGHLDRPIEVDQADTDEILEDDKSSLLETVQELFARSEGDDDTADDPVTVVMERLTNLSGGHPGVAQTIWEAIDDPVTPGAFPELPDGRDLSDDAAFVLVLVLSKEAVDSGQLESVAARVDVPRARAQLRKSGFLSMSGERIEISPASIEEAVATLKRRRLIW